MEPPYLILIGGATGVGTSTIASELSRIYPVRGFQRTDSIREVIRAYVGPLHDGKIFKSTFLAWKNIRSLYSDSKMGPIEKAVKGYRDQAEDVLLGVDAAITRDIKENINAIYEGVHILPGKLAEEDWYEFEPRKAIEGCSRLGINVIKREDYDDHVIEFLIDIEDPELHRERIKRREEFAPLRPSDRYLEKFDAIRSIRDFLVSEAARNSIHVIQNTTKEETAERCVQYITERTEGRFMPKTSA